MVNSATSGPPGLTHFILVGLSSTLSVDSDVVGDVADVERGELPDADCCMKNNKIIVVNNNKAITVHFAGKIILLDGLAS